MALLLMESFDCIYFAAKFALPDAFPKFNLNNIQAIGTGRRGTVGLKQLSGNDNYSVINFGTDKTDLIFGFALFVSSGGTASNAIFKVYDSTPTLQFCIDLTTVGRFRVKDALTGNVLAESADGAFSKDIYQYVEIKFTCTGTDSIEIRVNEVAVLGPTGTLDLRQVGSGGAYYVRLSGANTHFATNMTYLDDLYVLDFSGSTFNDFIGDVKVDAFMPTDDGYYTDFTPDTGVDHWAVIDEKGDTALSHYIESATATDKDSFTITPTGNLPTIYAIKVHNVSRNPDTGVSEGTPFIRMGGVDYPLDPYERGDTSQANEQIVENRPDTDGVWSKTILETDFEFGFEFSEVVS